MSTKKNVDIRLRLEALENRELLTVSPQLVGDFSLEPPGSEQQADNAWLGDELLFAADDGTGDVELWKSDGTPEGTVRVADIREGSGGSMPRGFVATEERVLFTAYTEEFGRELWSSDGTADGTVLVQDLTPGTASSPLPTFTNSGGKLYFSHDDELWSTDGTRENTNVMLETPGSFLTSMGDHLFFTTQTDDTTVLWKTDGTYAEPERVSSFSGRGLGEVHAIGDWLYFVTDDADGNHGLWKSDGTEEGTTGVDYSGEFPWLIPGPDFLLYVTEDWSNPNAFDPHLTLWRTNPADDQTESLRRYGSFDSYPGWFTPMGDHVYFTTGRSLYRIDDQLDRPERVARFEDPRHLREAGGMLYFVDAGRQLYRSDGTEQGTQLVETELHDEANLLYLLNGKDGNALLWGTSEGRRGLWSSNRGESTPTLLNGAISGPSQGSWESSQHVITVGERTYFKIESDLWQFDGQDHTIVEGVPTLADDPQFTQFDGLLYFVGKDQTAGATELWKTNGTEAGTEPVVFAGERFTAPDNLTVSGGKLYFVGPNQQGTRHIWQTDGTEAGTSVLLRYMDLLLPPSRLTDANGTLYFDVQAGTSSDLWKKEPGKERERVAGTSGWIQQMIPADDKVFLHVLEELDESDGDQAVRDSLWVSDGTAEGTFLLTDEYASSAFASGDKLFFLGHTEETGDELWVSDGTVAGTHLVKDIAVGVVGCGGNSGIKPVAYDGGIYFAAEDENGGRALWQSDGTEAGTVRVSGIHGEALASANGMVYFANTDEMGTELWQSDGTVEGSIRVADINPGPGSSMAKYPAAIADGKLYITADDGFHGNELWSIPLEAEHAIPGDADGSGVVDFEDFLRLSANFGKTDAVFADGDFNNNGTVDFADFLILSGRYGEQ